jgi:hypothetical protein
MTPGGEEYLNSLRSGRRQEFSAAPCVDLIFFWRLMWAPFCEYLSTPILVWHAPGASLERVRSALSMC